MTHFLAELERRRGRRGVELECANPDVVLVEQLDLAKDIGTGRDIAWAVDRFQREKQRVADPRVPALEVIFFYVAGVLARDRSLDEIPALRGGRDHDP